MKDPVYTTSFNVIHYSYNSLQSEIPFAVLRLQCRRGENIILKLQARRSGPKERILQTPRSESIAARI